VLVIVGFPFMTGMRVLMGTVIGLFMGVVMG
jgi:hypothetical protein